MKKTVLMGLLALSVTILGACFDFNMESSQSEQQNASSLTENVLSSETVVSSERFSSDESDFGSEENSDMGSDSSAETQCVVQFDSDGGTEVATVYLEKGEKLTMPEPPQKASTNYEFEFLGWYYNGEEWNFDNPVTEDMTLVAHWKEGEKYTDPFLPKD